MLGAAFDRARQAAIARSRLHPGTCAEAPRGVCEGSGAGQAIRGIMAVSYSCAEKNY